ncbi:MAG: hypothetical protein K6T66_07100 [Peptococcaceae bacterium]|nr:hypothetical protein [Peptococcaceae bacterium]
MSVKVQIVSWRTEPTVSINLESGLPQDPVLYIPASMAGNAKEINKLAVRAMLKYKSMKENMAAFHEKVLAGDGLGPD